MCVCMSVCLYVCEQKEQLRMCLPWRSYLPIQTADLYIDLPTYLSIYPSIYLHLRLSVPTFIYIYVSLSCVSIVMYPSNSCLFIRVSLCRSLSLSLCLSLPPSISLPICLSMDLSTYLSKCYLSVSLSVSLSIYLSISIYLTM